MVCSINANTSNRKRFVPFVHCLHAEQNDHAKSHSQVRVRNTRGSKRAWHPVSERNYPLMRIQSPLEDLKQQIANFFRTLAIAAKAFTMCPPFIYEGQVVRPITRTFRTNDGSWMQEDWKVTKVEFPYFWAVTANPDSYYERILGTGSLSARMSGRTPERFTVKFDLRDQTFMKVETD